MSEVLNGPIDSTAHRASSPVPPWSGHRAEETEPALEEAAVAKEAGPVSAVKEAADPQVPRAVGAIVAEAVAEAVVVAARKASKLIQCIPALELRLRDRTRSP